MSTTVTHAAIPISKPVVSKPVAWFKVRGNCRKRFDEDALRALGKDLRVRQISPLVCLPDGTIICGERRYRAAVLEGLESLDVIIITDSVTEAEQKRLQLAENLHRQDLSNYEKALGCVEYARSNPSMPLKQVAAELHCDASMVSRWMALERVVEPVAKALEADQITLVQMYDLSKLADEQQESGLAEVLVSRKRKRNGNAADSNAQSANSNGHSTPRSRSKFFLPSGVEMTVAATEMSLEGLQAALRDLLRLTEDAKDIDVLCEAVKIAKAEGVTELDVIAKALKAAKELANDQELDLRTLMTVAKGKKDKKKVG